MLYRNAFSHGVPAYHHAPHIRFPQTHDTIFVNRYTCYFNPHEYTFQFSFYLFVSVLSGPAKDIRLYNTKYCWLPSTGGYADIFNLVYGRFYPAVAAPGSVYTAAPCALCIFVEKEGAYAYLYEFLQEYLAKPIRIALIPEPISPAITGLLHPILIMPDEQSFSETELKYICLHEIAHYKEHHLWLEFLMEIICRIHWWNPFVQHLKKNLCSFWSFPTTFPDTIQPEIQCHRLR